MSLKTRVGLLAGAAALTLTGFSTAYPADPTANDDLAQRLAAAEAKIAAMEAAQNQDWLTEQRATEIRGLVQDVLADADTRASLLQTGMTAGYDNGAVMGSADGNWLLRANLLFQPRFIWNWQDDADTGAIDTNRYGFEVTRADLILDGHVVNPEWYYHFRNNFGNNSLSDRTDLLEAYVGHDFGNGLKIQMGAMKTPFEREELVEPEHQLAIERSSVNYFFTTGFSDGLQVSWEGDKFRVYGMLSDGANAGNTVWNAFDTEYAITGRAEWLASGNWDQFNDQTSPKGSETGVLVGGAIHFQEGEYGTPAGPEVEALGLTGDVSAEFNGFNLFGSLNYTDNDPAANNPLGIVVQGGVYLDETWELYGRYEFTDFDLAAVDDLNLVTVGVNKYFSSHNVKWSADLGYSFDGLGFSNGLTGVRSDIADEDGQLIFRTQWQILF